MVADEDDGSSRPSWVSELTNRATCSWNDERSGHPTTVRAIVTDTDPPWEPPLAGTEAEHLIGALERLRTTFRWKADDLDAAIDLAARIPAARMGGGIEIRPLAER